MGCTPTSAFDEVALPSIPKCSLIPQAGSFQTSMAGVENPRKGNTSNFPRQLRILNDLRSSHDL